MADVKISGLPASTTPLAGTEVLPIVQGGVTKQVSINNLTTGKSVTATQYTSTIATGTAPLVVSSTTEVANLRAANATSADTANQVKSNATTGVLQVTGPAAASTRVMTTPDANFTAARTDAAQTFTGSQTFNTSISVGNATPAASGSGITFPATQSAATDVNTLDDYEEGTFDVAITPASGSVTMNFVRLQYTKVGRQVTVTGECNISSVGSPSGAVTIGNLPFVNSAGSQRSARTSFFIRASNFTGAPSGVCIGFIAPSASVIDVYIVDNFSAADPGANLQATTQFQLCFSYMTTT